MFPYSSQTQEQRIQDTNASFSDDELQVEAFTANPSTKQPTFGRDNDSGSEISDLPSFSPQTNQPNQPSRPYYEEEPPQTSFFGGNNFSFNDTNSDNVSTQSPVHSYIDDEAELKEKRIMLQKIRRYEIRKGIKPEKSVSIHSSYDEIKEELDAIRKECQLESTVDKMKKALVFLTWGIETLNNKYDPVDIYLDGWSASIDEDIDSYEEVLEKIYDLYYDKLEMHPMAELALMLATSAAMHHASRSGKGMKIFQGPPAPQVPVQVQGPSGNLAEEILKEDLRNMNLQA